MKRTPRLAAGLVVTLAASAALQASPSAAYTTKGAWSFRSTSSLHPPKLSTPVPTIAGRLARGYFLTTSSYNKTSRMPEVGQGGPLMLDSRLQPVWFRPISSKQSAFNLQEQRYQGKPVLSWWQGVVSAVGVTISGEDVIVDQHYHEIGKPLVGQQGWVISPHDFVISGNDAWVTAYKTVTGVDLTRYGGAKNGAVLDVAVQKYDLTTGQLLFSWDALNPGGTANIPLSQSKQPAPKQSTAAWDAYHLNSIQLVGGSQFLASVRNTWSAYLVNIGSGKIVWTLSGDPKLSSFSLPKTARFHWQHHVELQPGGLVSMFDDACCPLLDNGHVGSASGSASRGLLLKLNMAKHTGSFVSQYTLAKGLFTATLGSMQLAGKGNVVVGWGSAPFFSEFSRGGKLLFAAKWPGPDISYRVFLDSWVGLPTYPPRGAARRSSGKTTVYASWNGATRVASWQVLAGSSKTHLTSAGGRTPKAGFETAISVSGSHTWFAVRALNSAGHVLGTSKPFRP
jgi:hypothetical protein